MRLIKEKTYNRYLRRIDKLIKINPKPNSPKGKELIRLALAVQKYETVYFPITHSDRKIASRHFRSNEKENKMKRVELEIYQSLNTCGLSLIRIKDDNSGEGYRVFGPKMIGLEKVMRTEQLTHEKIDRLIGELKVAKKFLGRKKK